ncbi:MAG: hypothetical protein ACRC1T_16960 [Clostridium chrysemydis]|uniref:hypothetical protein n=1 Tax=Clostridium chrysemydis TaxID=2665504 RepID=UPI003F3F033B
MSLNNIQKEIFSIIPSATDIIPVDFDFMNGFAIGVQIGNSITEKDYCEEIDLEIKIVGLIPTKMELQYEASKIDKIINNYVFKNTFARIVRENVYSSSYFDKEKFNIVLMYTIKKY